MRRSGHPRIRLWVTVLCASCATARPPKPAPADLAETLMLGAKKVDFAIGETKRMIQRSRGADYLPDLYMRLAELYTERARHAWLLVYERQRAKGNDSRAFEAPEARLLKNLAIGVYERLLKEFPKYSRGDEALFLMAHEHRELGEFDAMKATYEKLIENHPRSPHRLEAYLVLGDAAFDRSDLSRAEQYYNLVLAVSESHVHALARYKLAWVRVNREDCKGAVRLFEKILRDKTTPQGKKSLILTQRSLNIARESLVDLAYCYPDVYPEKPAVPYFRSLAATSADYVAGMRRVANRFFVKAMYAQAVGALREVLNAAVADEEALETARKLYDNVIKGKVFDSPGADVERIGRVFEARYFDHRLPKPQRDKLAVEFEAYARDIATRAHVAAKEGRGATALAAAAAGYKAYLSYFGKASARREIEENLAEALLQAEDFLAAGRAFERVQAAATKPEARRQACLNAIAAYQQALEKGSLSRVERLQAWGGLRAVGRIVLTDNPSDANAVSIKLSIARSYYDAGEYQRAAELFYALARQYPTSNEAVVSGHLALDALRLAENFEGLATMGRRMIADARLGDAKFKQEIQDIVAKTEQRQVTELTVTGGSDREEQLLSMAKRHRGSQLGEQALYNTLLVARANGDIERFYQLGEEFLEQYPKSSHRVDVCNALATVASDRADYDRAAQYLTASYAADPNARESTERLWGAATIRAVLGDGTVVGDVKKLWARGASGRMDELLLQVARAGNLSAIEELLAGAPVGGVVPSFLRGFLAFQRGDRDDAAKFLGEATRGKAESEAGAEALARGRFLLGEVAYGAFASANPSGDIANVVTEKSELLTAVDRAYAQAIQSRDARWALAALARVADAYAKFAGFMRDLKLPEQLSPEERNQLKQVMEAKAEEAAKRSAELRGLCAKKARDALVFSDAARSCLMEQPFSDKVVMFGRAGGRHSADPPGAAALRQGLLKNPRSGDTLLKLAEIYLGTGDLGMALLVLDRAEDVDDKSSAIQNLRGVTLYRAGEPDAAYAAFQRAVSLDGGNLKARGNLAAHYLIYGHVDKAQAELKRIGGAPTQRGEVSEHPELARLGALGEKK